VQLRPATAADYKVEEDSQPDHSETLSSFVSFVLSEAVLEYTGDVAQDFEYDCDSDCDEEEFQEPATVAAAAVEVSCFDDEDEDCWTAAAALTEEALHSAMLTAPVPRGYRVAHLGVPRKTQGLLEKVEEACEVSVVSTCDGKADGAPRSPGQQSRQDVDPIDEDFDDFEEIFSMASADSWEEEERELEATRFASLAMRLARDAVEKGLQDAEDDEEPEVKAEQSVEDIRLQAQASLLEAAMDGRLLSQLAMLAPALSSEQKEVSDALDVALDGASTNHTKEEATAEITEQSRPLPESPDQEPVLSCASKLPACDGRFDRRLTASTSAAPIPAEPFPLSRLPLSPLLLQGRKEAEASSEAPLCAEPSVPMPRQCQTSRSHRRVISRGVRPTTTQDLGSSSSEIASSTFNSEANRSSKKVGLRHLRLQKDREAAMAFKMDEGSGSETPERESSLTRAYDAMGKVEFFSLKEPEDRTQNFTPLFASHLPSSSSKAGRSSSLAGHKRGCSAMALDLGEDVAPGVSPWSPQSSMNLTRFSPRASSTGAVRMGRKQANTMFDSLPPLHEATGKHSGSGILPILASSSSAGSIAWSVHMAKSAAKRNGLASVF